MIEDAREPLVVPEAVLPEVDYLCRNARSQALRVAQASTRGGAGVPSRRL